MGGDAHPSPATSMSMKTPTSFPPDHIRLIPRNTTPSVPVPANPISPSPHIPALLPQSPAAQGVQPFVLRFYSHGMSPAAHRGKRCEFAIVSVVRAGRPTCLRLPPS